jgi:excisionase family DNA binding protein
MGRAPGPPDDSGAALGEGRRTPGIEPRLLTLEDVATYLNVSAAQAYSLVRSGELPAIKLGGRGVWRVDRRELDAYIERKQAETQEWARAHPLNPRER